MNPAGMVGRALLLSSAALLIVGCNGSDSSGPITLALSETDVEVFERDGAAPVTITASGPMPGDTEVRLLAVGTAEAGADYDDTLTFTFPAGATEATFQIPIVDDTEIEGPETLSVSLDSVGADRVSIDSSQSINITILPYIKQLTNSPYTVCLLTEDGEVKCWGENWNFLTGTGASDTIGDGPNEMGSALEAANTGDTPITAIGNNQFATCGLGTDGMLRCWGRKTHLGLNTPSAIASDHVGDDLAELGNALPTVDLGTGRTVRQFSLTYSHACSILDNGRIKCWGDNRNGRLGIGDTEFRGDDDNEMGDNLPYVDLGTDDSGTPWKAKAIAAGYATSCAILSNDQVKCWGRNNNGQLGIGDTADRGDGLATDNTSPEDDMGNNLPFIDLGEGRSAKSIHPYYQRTCAILDDNSLKCWGQAGYNGPFGNGLSGTQAPQTIDTGEHGVLSVGMNEYNTCVLLTNNELKCLGDNSYAQLGHDKSYITYGKAVGQTLLDAPVTDLGTGRYAVDLPAAGYEFNCALLNTNEVKCWGYGEYGVLGNADFNRRYIGDGEDEDSNPSREMGDSLPAIEWY